jgi:hypothetical protein
MIITPAKFEDDFNALPKRDPDSWVNMDECVILTKGQWGLIRDTLDSLGYGATVKKMDEALK